MAHRRTFPVSARFATAVLAVAVVASFVPGTVAGAGAAPSKQQVQHAQARVKQLKTEVVREQQQLADLQGLVANATEALLQAQDEYDRVNAQLLAVQVRLQAAKDRYSTITARLNERAHEAFISGPGSDLEFILGSTSLSDLSDRMEFIDAVAQTDVDLAQQVQNTKNELTTSATELSQLEQQKKDAYVKRRAKEQELQANLSAQQKILDHIDGQLAEARTYAKKLSKQYRKWLSQQTGVTWGNGLLKACPVGAPRAFGDDFGAPRYSGGFHLHAGVDIVAPMGTPIYAPFDGVAYSSYDTLGGNAEYVRGSQGYVYNAHLSGYSADSNGPVQAGEVIGYVGDSGDAQGGVTHDHFEWHPNVIPTDWPQSSYGYSVIGTAVNPYPLLVDACM